MTWRAVLGFLVAIVVAAGSLLLILGSSEILTGETLVLSTFLSDLLSGRGAAVLIVGGATLALGVPAYWYAVHHWSLHSWGTALVGALGGAAGPLLYGMSISLTARAAAAGAFAGWIFWHVARPDLAHDAIRPPPPGGSGYFAPQPARKPQRKRD